ncbi:transglycosylase family protein [Streptomyces sp. NBC_00435]|uniref:transglycosylase family protein n=1 Tax=Streptomyces sp. NBC_00435 TaxID=2903649 RepID=UPI002E229AC4
MRSSVRNHSFGTVTVTALLALAAPLLTGTEASAASLSTWEKVANCEASGNWQAIDPSGTYFGGLQFAQSTWQAYGGTAYASRADRATKQQQILIGEKVLAGQGQNAWPYCGPKYNLGADHADPYPSTPAPVSSWKAQVVVNGGGAIFHGLRKADGTWTGFGNIESQAGDIGTVGSVADAGLNGDTHVVAVGGNGHVYHTIRLANGSWGTFGDVDAAAGALGPVTKVSAVTIGTDVNVLAVADGKLNHSVRHFDGSWTPFGDVSAEAGALPAPVTSAAEASVNGQLQVVVVAGGRVYHSIRGSGGTWSAWGDVYAAAGGSGTASDVAVAGTGSDMQIIVTSNNGTKQVHGARLGDGTWLPLTDLAATLGGFTATGVSAATVDGELQATFVTTDNRILHTIRRVNGTWTGAGAINLTGVNGNHYAASITGTL